MLRYHVQFIPSARFFRGRISAVSTTSTSGSDLRQGQVKLTLSSPFGRKPARRRRAIEAHLRPECTRTTVPARVEPAAPTRFSEGPARLNVFAPSILTARRQAWHLKSPSQVCFCTHGIGGHAPAIIDNMTAPYVMTRRSCDDRADRHVWIGIREEIQDPSVWTA